MEPTEEGNAAREVAWPLLAKPVREKTRVWTCGRKGRVYRRGESGSRYPRGLLCYSIPELHEKFGVDKTS